MCREARAPSACVIVADVAPPRGDALEEFSDRVLFAQADVTSEAEVRVRNRGRREAIRTVARRGHLRRRASRRTRVRAQTASPRWRRFAESSTST